MIGTTDGGLVAAGLFDGTAVFGPGESHATTLHQQGTKLPDDGYVARFNSDGTLAWIHPLLGDRVDAAILADGSVVVVGLFGETATFTGGGKTQTLTPDGYDTFIVSYSASGALQWAKRIAGPAQVEPDGITLLTSGDFAVTGSIEPSGPTDLTTRGHAVFAPGETNETTLSGTNFDLFLARYTSIGALVWAKTAPGASPGRHALAALPDGGAVVGAFYPYPTTTAVFGPGEPGAITIPPLAGTSSQLISAFFLSDGTARAARIFTVGGMINGLATLADGSPIVAGGFSGATTFGPLDPHPMMFVGPTSVILNVLSMDMFLARLVP